MAFQVEIFGTKVGIVGKRPEKKARVDIVDAYLEPWGMSKSESNQRIEVWAPNLALTRFCLVLVGFEFWALARWYKLGTHKFQIRGPCRAGGFDLANNMAANQNIGLVTGLGGHFATKVCNRRRRSATNPSATSPLKTTALYTEVRDKGL